MEPAERTLLVLYAPSPPLLLTRIRQRLVAAGLDIVLTEMLDREELEEAGIELDAEGEEEGGEQRTGGEGGEGQDCAVVLSGVGAVQVLKELAGMRGARQDSFASLYPELRLHVSPSVSAATMSIDALFPSLHESLNIPTPSVNPLSNDAQPGTALVQDQKLSPSVLRALERVQQEEDEMRDEGTPHHGYEADGTIDEEEEGEELEDTEMSPIARRVRTESVSTTTSTTSFQARLIPASHFTAPSPRLNKTTALRLGLPLPPPRAPSSPTPSPQPIRVIATPKSLATPSITPRGTKSSLLRSSTALSPLPTASTPRMALSTAERSSAHHASGIYVDSPSASRRLSVASTASPRIAVRMNKGASLRAGLEIREDPRAVRRRESSVGSSISEVSVSSRRESLGVREPKIVPRGTRTSSLRGSTAEFLPPSSVPMVRQLSEGSSNQEGSKKRESMGGESRRPVVEPRLNRTTMLRMGGEVKMDAGERRRSVALTGAVPTQDVPVPKRRESITVLSSRPPSITPRMNRSILLRQALDSPALDRSTTSSPLPRAPRSSAPSIEPRMNRSVELRNAKANGGFEQVGSMGRKGALKEIN